MKMKMLCLLDSILATVLRTAWFGILSHLWSPAAVHDAETSLACWQPCDVSFRTCLPACIATQRHSFAYQGSAHTSPILVMVGQGDGCDLQAGVAVCSGNGKSWLSCSSSAAV